MTEPRDSVTAAELAEYLRQVEEMWWEDYEPIQKMLGFLAALRRERDEALRLEAATRGLGCTCEELIAARADIAKKDAALREIEYLDRPQMRGQPRRKTIQQIALAALGPAAQGAFDPALSPGHTDMMVDPDTLDAFMEANPLPPDLAPAPSAGETQVKETNMTDIDALVSRFLAWKLPEDFNPDGGISFQRTFNENTPYPMKSEPTGTNLFDARQAEAMLRHVLGDTLANLASEKERLIEQLKVAVWSDSEECKLLTAENERLRAAAPAPSAGETVLEIVEHAIREKKRGLYSFAINYDRPGGPAIGFDGNTNEFYMALEELGLHHLETIRAALAEAATTGEPTND